MNSRPGVLVTDGFWRKSLAAVRALGRAGVRVVVGEHTPLATALFSKYASARVLYPRLTYQPRRFVRALVHHAQQHHCNVIFPMETSTLLALRSYPQEIPAHLRIPFPSLPLLQAARNKGWVMQLAQRLDIPVPRTVVVDQHNWSTALQQAQDLPLPLIIKPCVGSGSVGLQRIVSYAALGPALRRKLVHYGACLVQEALPTGGEGLGVSLLFDRQGRLLARFTHRRLREYPVHGGPSTLRESTRCPPAEQAAQRLLEALGWYGVAMVEFKKDLRTGKYVLLEINPRFWGSLALAVSAGVNFPFLLYQLALDQKCAPVMDYPLGQRCRWLLPGDLLHFACSNTPWREFRPLYGPHLSYDIISCHDPLPVIGRLFSLLAVLFDRRLHHWLNR